MAGPPLLLPPRFAPRLDANAENTSEAAKVIKPNQRNAVEACAS